MGDLRKQYKTQARRRELRVESYSKMSPDFSRDQNKIYKKDIKEPTTTEHPPPQFFFSSLNIQGQLADLYRHTWDCRIVRKNIKTWGVGGAGAVAGLTPSQ